MKHLALLALLLAAAGTASAQTTLRIGLASDPTMLDPARSGAFTERVVFTALCDRLLDVGPDLAFRPELATAWAWEDNGLTLRLTLREGGRFHDGTPLDAAAVKVNLDRYRSAPESLRRSELRPVASVEVPDARTVLIRLSQPHAPLLSVLSDRAGMMLSPTALARLGARIGEEPVCSGPFRLTRRVAQDRIEMERVPEHWNAANIHVQRIVMRPLPDSTVRLLNLRAGQLDLIERVAPSDVPGARRDARIAVAESTAIAYQAVLLNTAPQSALRDPRLREAFERALDREAINRVALEGLYVPSNQPEAPGAPFHLANRRVPPRDVARARELLREAGQPNPSVSLLAPNNPVDAQVAEVMQAMLAEAGFRVRIETMEAAALVARQEAGRYDAAFAIWSGRADPDGNIAPWIASDGFLNRMAYREPAVDAALAAARRTGDVAERRALYDAAAERWMADRPLLVLYHYRWFWGLRARVTGFEPSPDGLIRFSGLRVPAN